ncbi:MAG: MBOAT family protein, partial [Firmicutes bacterium]|nr:MBOAT family protein [Bacillota bacterium]
IDLMQNFDRPYFASSIKDFWRRWHISLSTWFKDYVYIPLGGSRCSSLRRDMNLMTTFCVSGLWHGANWTFLLLGMLHGAYQVIENHVFRRNKDKKTNKIVLGLTLPLRWVVTFVIVVLTWIPFRANSIADCFFIFKNLTTGFENLTDVQFLYDTVNSLGLGIFEILIVSAAILFLMLIELISIKFEDVNVFMMKLPFLFRFAFYYVIAAIILAAGVFSGLGEFIYFQF